MEISINYVKSGIIKVNVDEQVWDQKSTNEKIAFCENYLENADPEEILHGLSDSDEPNEPYIDEAPPIMQIYFSEAGTIKAITKSPLHDAYIGHEEHWIEDTL